MKNPDTSKAVVAFVDGRGIDLGLAQCDPQFRQIEALSSRGLKQHRRPYAARASPSSDARTLPLPVFLLKWTLWPHTVHFGKHLSCNALLTVFHSPDSSGPVPGAPSRLQFPHRARCLRPENGF